MIASRTLILTQKNIAIILATSIAMMMIVSDYKSKQVKILHIIAFLGSNLFIEFFDRTVLCSKACVSYMLLLALAWMFVKFNLADLIILLTIMSKICKTYASIIMYLNLLSIICLIHLIIYKIYDQEHAPMIPSILLAYVLVLISHM